MSGKQKSRCVRLTVANPLPPYPVPERSLVCRGLVYLTARLALPLMARCDGQFDALFPQGLALVVRTRRFSISHLQRHLRIGYGRACRLMAAIEATNLVKREIGNTR